MQMLCAIAALGPFNPLAASICVKLMIETNSSRAFLVGSGARKRTPGGDGSF
jgi:hypothetical protein